MRIAGAVLAAALLLSVAPAAKPVEPACAGFTPPRRASTPIVTLPASYTAARLGGEVVDEVVISKDGNLASVRLVRARVDLLAPFGEVAVKNSTFTGGAIEGNPVAVRGLVSTVLGTVTAARAEPEYDLLWAYVPEGSSKEARWQLAESVDKLTLTGHVGTPLPQGAEIFARSPSGAEKKLLSLPSSSAPVELRETVSTGRFFAKSGDYRLELKSGGKTLAYTTLTIAPDFKSAIVNACNRIS
jgi:hypothetical protein